MSLATFTATCPLHDLTFTGADGVAALAAHMRTVHNRGRGYDHIAKPYVMPKAHPWKAPSVLRTAYLTKALAEPVWPWGTAQVTEETLGSVAA